MVAKIVSILIVAVLYVLLSVFGLATMLLAMNGYNDRAAEWAIPAYVISQIIFALISFTVAFLSVWMFQDKLNWNVFVASILSIIIGLFIAVILTIVAIGVGIGFGDWAFRN